MSSSYRDAVERRPAIWATAGLLVVALGAGPVDAAETYIQPQVELRIEDNSNFGLEPGGSPDGNVAGVIADMQALIGVATPRSETSIRPRLRFQEYPDRDELQRVEGFLDLKSSYQWERSQLDFIGKYSRQDSYNFDTRSGEFDPLDPNDPAGSGTGQVQVGETRTMVDLRPKVLFDLTERFNLGVGGQYQATRYDAESGPAAQDDYDYSVAETFLAWAVDPRSVLALGAYVSKFEVTDGSRDTDAYGANVGYRYQWSDIVGVELLVFYETNDTTEYVPVRQEDSSSGFGGTATAYRKGEVDEWRVTAGHTFTPTGDGKKMQSDQARLQYDRKLTERVSLRAIGRYEARRDLSGISGGEDRDYARADISLRWLMSRAWSVDGGYAYIWQDRESAGGSADNNKIFISVGYKGLGRQRR